jgi:hypothetical protein
MSSVSRWKWVAVGLLAGGLLNVGAGRTSAFQRTRRDREDAPANTEALFDPAPRVDPAPVGPRTVAELAEARVQAARNYLETARPGPQYAGIDFSLARYIAASRCLMESERDAARTKADEITALRSHKDRMIKIEERERAKLEVGAGSIPKIQEAEYYRREAEYWLARALAGADRGAEPSRR